MGHKLIFDKRRQQTQIWFMNVIDFKAMKLISGCDWEGYLTRDDFLEVAYVSMQKQANRYDDIKAAFR